MTCHWCVRALVPGIVLLSVLTARPALPQSFKTLYSFTGGDDGGLPQAGLTRDSAGNLYGTTSDGGYTSCWAHSPYGCGTVFKLTPSGTETTLYTFTGTDGGYPLAGLLRDGSGNLYGTTFLGGDSSCNAPAGCGVVFRLSVSGRETVLHTFTGGTTDGESPAGSLITGGAGNLYGTAAYGGTFGDGAVFSLNASGDETVLHSFEAQEDDGESPYGGLIRDAAGNLYGTTSYGGEGWGTVFELGTSGSEMVLYKFVGNALYPYGGVIRDAVGNLYGTALQGGDTSCNSPSGCGSLFKLSPTGVETALHEFAGGRDGEFPYGSLVRDTAGNLWGTTYMGGDVSCNPPNGCGTVFKLSPSGKETILHAFTGSTDGAFPYAGLIQDTVGNLYGTATSGGAHGWGTVFEISPK